MKCPKCKDIELSKKAFHSPFACPQCEGMWLASDQLTQWTAHTESLSEMAVANETDYRTGLCPEGHGLMIRAKFDMENPFYLEKCLHCSGIWFDKGEWHRVVQAHLAENIDIIWSTAWQRKQRLEREKDKYLEINRTLLGVELYEAILALSSRLRQHPERLRAIAFLQQQVLGK